MPPTLSRDRLPSSPSPRRSLPPFPYFSIRPTPPPLRAPAGAPGRSRGVAEAETRGWFAMNPPGARHSCLRLRLSDGAGTAAAAAAIFVKGTCFAARFDLSITDSLDAWTCNATETEVRQRAEQWDQLVPEYIALAERYLGSQQPGSVYKFEDAGNGQRRVPGE